MCFRQEKMAKDKDYLQVDFVRGHYRVNSKTRHISGDGTILDLTTIILAHCKFGSEIKQGEPEYELQFSSQALKFLGKGEMACLDHIVTYHNRVVRSIKGNYGGNS